MTEKLKTLPTGAVSRLRSAGLLRSGEVINERLAERLADIGYAELHRTPGLGSITLKQICSWVSAFGYRIDPANLGVREAREKAALSKVRLSRRAIENTVRSMGGSITWLICEEAYLRNRNDEKRKSRSEWMTKRAEKNFQDEIDRMIGMFTQAGEEGRLLTLQERNEIDAMLEKVGA